jgi:predicted enzyme related to lactoylglutathione lyase
MPVRSGRSRGSKRVVGVGGIFFRAKKPKELSAWYRNHLGIKTQDNVALFTWQPRTSSKRVGYTVWSILPHDTSYFRSKKLQFMINYRVKNLNKLLAELRREGVRVDRKVENLEYGKFGWITDPEGNRIELWEPPRTYKAPEPEIPSE